MDRMTTPQKHVRVGELFLATCELSDEDQTSYLDQVCGDDPGLRAAVEALLREDAQVESLLATRERRLRESNDPVSDASDSAYAAELEHAGSRECFKTTPRTHDALHLQIPGYRIERVLGHGGMGIVYYARHTDLGRDVALKVLPAVVGAASPSMVARFKREAAAAARLRHPGIVPIYDFGQSDDCYFYTMELVAGAPLNAVIRRLAMQGAELPWLETGDRPFAYGYFVRVASWLSAVADALQYAHDQGIVHRDIKPGNLILSDDGRMMITDFGLALTEHEETITQTGGVMGTLRYLSPEQALGRRVPIDHRTDIYSLGATLYELLTLQPMFSGDDQNQLLAAVIGQAPARPSSVQAAVPPDLETICLKAVEKLPKARYATATELADDLKAFLADEPITARRPRLPRRLAKSAIRNQLGLGIACVALLVAGFSLLLGGVYRKAKLDERVADLVRRGLVLQQDQRWDEAGEMYLAALDLDPKDARAMGNLVIARKEQYDAQTDPDPALLDEADEYCRRAVAIAPQSAGLWNVYGVIQKKLGDLDQAVEAYQAGLAVEQAPPNMVIALLDNLAEAQWLLGDAESAEENMRNAAQFADETDTPAWFVWQDLASLELSRGDVQALEDIQRGFASKSEPNWRLHVIRARILLGIDAVLDVPSALRDAYAALEEADPDPRVERIMALALLRNGDFGEAVVHAQNAMAQGDLSAMDHLIAALAEANRGQLETAQTHLEAARDVWPQELIDAGYVVSTERGMLWFDTADELTDLLEEAEVLLDDVP